MVSLVWFLFWIIGSDAALKALYTRVLSPDARLDRSQYPGLATTVWWFGKQNLPGRIPADFIHANRIRL